MVAENMYDLYSRSGSEFKGMYLETVDGVTYVRDVNGESNSAILIDSSNDYYRVGENELRSNYWLVKEDEFFSIYDTETYRAITVRMSELSGKELDDEFELSLRQYELDELEEHSDDSYFDENDEEVSQEEDDAFWDEEEDAYWR